MTLSKFLKSFLFICSFCRSEQEALREKLQNLERKILVGGENLLEKADLQGQLLLQSAQELEQTMSQEQLLQQELQRKEVRVLKM